MKRFLVVMLAVAFVSGCGSPSTGSKSKPKATPKETAKRVQDKFLNEGIQYLQEANTVEAVRSFDQAIRQNPLDTRGYMILGQTYMRMNNYDRAIDTLLAASRVSPDQGEIYYLLAVNHRLAGNPELAKENVQKSIELFRQTKDERNFKKSLVLLKGLMDAD